MPRVVALYRYPVKGFAPEPRDSLTVVEQGRIAGDRVLGFRLADSATPDDAWSRKYELVVLANTPGLARVSARFDSGAMRLALTFDGVLLADEALDAEGRRRLCAALERCVLSLPDNPLSGHPQRVPLRLVGDGVTPRYQDNVEGQATLHSRETLAVVAAAAGDPTLDEARFRSNIVIEGVKAWQENEWLGHRIRIGEVEFDVVRHKTRCLATHANPSTGQRDIEMMPLLMRRFAQKEPTFAVGMVASGGGRQIRVGDTVSVVA
ncbi:MAG TPA: MOSC domain-containing protein [Burkholderiales bacterium]|nr:MOSC domain-containing protein [Burkholderiales bacterium]